MSQSRAGRAGAALLVLLASLPASGQSPGLRIVSAGPTGEVGQLADAEEVRIVFSEPMVPVGTIPDGQAPAWVRMTPALPGSTFYWSGTKTLIFSPDTSAPLPYATRFTVRVDPSAAALSGRTLGAPYELTFTTPTVRLLSAESYRRTGKHDSPAMIVLRFNQPMRPADVVAHARVALAPHKWAMPVLPQHTRERLEATDPAGLERFDRKVDAAARVAASSDPLQIRVADSTGVRQFVPNPALVVVETTTVPPTNAWLTVRIDSTLPGAQGSATHPEQSTDMRLDETFFVGLPCLDSCDPHGENPIRFSRPVALSAFTRAVRVSDVDDGGVARPVTAERQLPEANAGRVSDVVTLDLAGFPAALPARTRRVQIDDSFEAADGQTLGYPWSADSQYAHASYGAALPSGVWEASAGSRIPVRARNVLSVKQWAERFDADAVMPLLRGPLQQPPFVVPFDDSQQFRLALAPDVAGVHDFDLRPWLSTAGTGLVQAAIDPGEVVPGTYPVKNRLARPVLLQVTNLGVTVKDSPQSTLVFVTRLDTGVPVAAARVAIVGAGNSTLWKGTTDTDGLAMAPALKLRVGRLTPSFIVTAEKEGDLAFVGSDWGPSLHPTRWGLPYALQAPESILRGSVFMDRGVYRAGEEVQFKAVLRRDTPEGMRMLRKGTTLTATVSDDDGRDVDTRTLTLNRWSSVEWTWRVPKEGRLGSYEVTISQKKDTPNGTAGSVSGDFLVAAFRKPEFRVDTTLTGAPPVLGSTLRGAIEAKYLFGAGLGARPVSWFARRSFVQAPPQTIRDRFPDARYAVGYMPRLQAEARPLPKTELLGSDGRLDVSLPTQVEGDAAYGYQFEGDVEEVSGQHIANRAFLVVHPASLYVAVSRPPMFVSTATGASVGVSAVGLDGTRVGDVAVKVSLLREEWVEIRRPDAPGSTSWERREVPSGEWSVRSSTADVPLQIPVRDGGCYVLRATARDDAGRATRTELTFYATGAGLASWRGEGNRITLTPERTTWKPGETARIMIQSPWPDATALVTVEREGITSHRRFRVRSTQDVVDVPITRAHVPNVFVSVLLVKGRTSSELGPDGIDPGKPSYRVGYTALSVDDPSRRLSVKVSSDRDEYRPGERVTVSASVESADGRRRPREVTLWAVDYGLLSLTSYRTPDVLEQIYVSKPLQVMTQDSRERLISRPEWLAVPESRAFPGTPNLSVVEVFASGEISFTLSGSLGESETGSASINVLPALRAGPDAVEIRQDFRPLVFWLGSATTDAGGRATTTVTLPDSLTTYRIMAVAGDDESQFGFGEREVRVTRPLTLTPAFPRFLNTGDRASFGAVVTNFGPAPGDAVVTIESLDPDALQFAGSGTRTVTLSAGASVTVTFDASARRRGQPRVRMTATLNGQRDAFELPLPVLSSMRLQTNAAYGETAGRAIEQLALPHGIAPDAGGLSVELASTALVGLGEGARYVVEYPFATGEVRASRALTLLLASDVGGAFRLPGLKADEYRAEARAALSALAASQCDDGGFVDWPDGCRDVSSPYLTAYVLHVMGVASKLGVRVDGEVVNDGLDFLEQRLMTPPPEVQWWPIWGASQAFAVKVLAEHGRNPAAAITRLVAAAERLPIFSLSHLADALAAAGDRGQRYQDVVRRLTNALRIDADRAHVEEIDDAALCWLWNTNARASAVVLEGLARRRDDPALAAPLVRWLLAERKDGRWLTTHENAMVLEALAGYYRAFESDVPKMTSTVSLGPATIGRAAFKGRSTSSHQIALSMADLLKEVSPSEAQPLTIAKEGTGRLYYTARIQTYAPEPPGAVDRGFQVARRFERYVAEGSSPSATTFDVGDLVRVTVSVTLRGEGSFVVLTDPLPAGFEPIDSLFQTTSSALAWQAARARSGPDPYFWWRRGSFDHVERHDDRVIAFATRLGSGRHEFSYLARATTAGTFAAAGARMEAMYAPELAGRSAAATITIK